MCMDICCYFIEWLVPLLTPPGLLCHVMCPAGKPVEQGQLVKSPRGRLEVPPLVDPKAGKVSPSPGKGSGSTSAKGFLPAV